MVADGGGRRWGRGGEGRARPWAEAEVRGRLGSSEEGGAVERGSWHWLCVMGNKKEVAAQEGEIEGKRCVGFDRARFNSAPAGPVERALEAGPAWMAC